MKGYDHVSSWYDTLVKEKGHYYHEKVIIPKIMTFLKDKRSVLDLACGQGVLQRHLAPGVEYLGIDISDKMISRANSYNKNKNHRFIKKDLSLPIDVDKKDFEVATIILSLQDIDKPSIVLQNASRHLKKDGSLIIVINHPCFRIPRQSSWGIDEKIKIQYRRIDRYMTSMKIPISVNPFDKKNQRHLFANHFSLSMLSSYLYENNFLIEKIDELISDKKSEGAKAKMENRSREEFPLFMLIAARKR